MGHLGSRPRLAINKTIFISTLIQQGSFWVAGKIVWFRSSDVLVKLGLYLAVNFVEILVGQGVGDPLLLWLEWVS